MKHFENCVPVRGCPYFFPHSLQIETGKYIHIEHENKLNRGHIKKYYIDKLHFQIVATATDTKGHKFYIYSNPEKPEGGIIAVTKEDNFGHYD